MMSQKVYILCDMNKGYSESILKKIKASPPGAVFVYSDFANIADSTSARKALERFTKDNLIKRIKPGIFYKPAFSKLLQEEIPFSPDDVAKAIARNFHWNIAPCGNYALNILGLSTQVPAVWSYVSDGPYKEYEFGKIKISFKRRTNREISGMSDISIIVVQALKTLGKENIDDNVIKSLSKKIKASDKKKLLLETKEASEWVYKTIQKICKE